MSDATSTSTTTTTTTTTTKTKDSFLHLAGSKLRSRLTSQLNENASAATSDFAQSQLKKMGWQEGTGLGKRRDGIATHIRVHKRADEQGGIGKPSESSAAIQHFQNEWWKGSVGDILAKLGNQSKSKKSKKNKDTATTTNKRKDYTDQELFEATGGARFGMRAQGAQKGKWQRTEGEQISQAEEVARGKVEWNGLTAPKVLLSSATSARTPSEEDEQSPPPPKTKKRKISDEDQGQDQVTAEKVAKKERKQAKRAKQERKEEKKAKKQAKKEKKSKSSPEDE
jgi:Pin2-interacting protein X1